MDKKKFLTIYMAFSFSIISVFCQDIKIIQKEISYFEAKLAKINKLLDAKGKPYFFHGRKKRLKIYGQKDYTTFQEGDFCIVYISGNKSYLRSKDGVVHSPTREINYNFLKVALPPDKYLTILDEYSAACEKKTDKLEIEIDKNKDAIDKHIDQLVAMLGRNSPAVTKHDDGSIYINEALIVDTRKNKLVSKINKRIKKLGKKISDDNYEIIQLEKTKANLKALRNKAQNDLEAYLKEKKKMQIESLKNKAMSNEPGKS